MTTEKHKEKAKEKVIAENALFQRRGLCFVLVSSSILAGMFLIGYGVGLCFKKELEFSFITTGISILIIASQIRNYLLPRENQ